MNQILKKKQRNRSHDATVCVSCDTSYIKCRGKKIIVAFLKAPKKFLSILMLHFSSVHIYKYAISMRYFQSHQKSINDGEGNLFFIISIPAFTD